MITAKRSPESPASLASGKYGGQDVVEALLRDFLGKCYLCEVKISARELSIDHRKHKVLFPELECDWNNLFPTCRDCNERRPRPKVYPPEGLLDPTSEDIGSRLEQTLRPDSPTGDERPPPFTALVRGRLGAGFEHLFD